MCMEMDSVSEYKNVELSVLLPLPLSMLPPLPPLLLFTEVNVCARGVGIPAKAS